MILQRWFGALWARPNLVRLVAAQSVSALGSQVTLFALPLTAILVLDVDAAEMGLLRAAGFAPALLLSLLGGVVVDRVRRRRS